MNRWRHLVDARRLLVTGTRSLLTGRTASQRDSLLRERDAWIRAAPGRSFEVTQRVLRSEKLWTITLVELGRTVASGHGTTWERALSQALSEARTRKESAS